MVSAQTILCSTSLLITAISALPLARSNPGPVVTDTTNSITYHGNVSSNVESFLNIRYGRDTSGSNRFAPPVPFKYPNGTVVDASANGFFCAQPNVSYFGEPSLTGPVSEDCLTLRVDRVAGTNASSNLPVMVYLYGGGFTTGSIYQSSYNPAGLLLSAKSHDTPVIYAAMNYRLNLFGFASTSALLSENSVNVGLLDQYLALQWIKANIHLFGGDANNITIFGESAGAFSVGSQIVAYGGSREPLFQRAIMESGSATSVLGQAGNVTFENTLAIADLTNCTSSNAAAELECLRALPVETLLPIIGNYSLEVSPVGGVQVWQPVVHDSEDSILPAPQSQLLRLGNFSKNIDLVAGWNHDDGAIFVDSDITTDAAVLAEALRPLQLDNATASAVLTLYPLSSFNNVTSGNNTATAQYMRAAQIFRDITFTCPSIFMAEAMYNHSNASTTTSYLFENNVTTYATAEKSGNASYLGVIHTSELAFVFDDVASSAYNMSVLGGVDQADVALGAMWSGSWAKFVTDGNVSGGNETLQGWSEIVGAQANETSVLAGELDVMVIGGPHAGLTTTDDKSGPLTNEMLVQRCAFWNSEELQKQLQV